jgi:hypothetical protein
MPRYFLDLAEVGAPLPWDPHAGPRPERPDTRYFAGVLTEMENRLSDRKLEFYLTWNVNRLPSYGNRVVAIVLGDEAGRIPAYTGRVRAVFKSYGTQPVLGSPPLSLGPAGLLPVAQWGYRWLRWLPGGSAHASRLARSRIQHAPLPRRLFTIPLGTYNQLELPMLSVERRPTDLFFAGSVEHRESSRWRSPKQLARHEMLAAVERLGRRRPELRIDIRLTEGFAASASASAPAYSRGLMDAKICLAPRGTSLETFRVFEGLRYGCVVVTERLPRSWFYDGAPILQLKRWSELDRVISLLLDDQAALARWHVQALDWWRERCSEAAVGRYVAECLNALSADDGMSCDSKTQSARPGDQALSSPGPN